MNSKMNQITANLSSVELTRPPKNFSLGGMSPFISAGDVATRIAKTVRITVERGMTRLTFNAMGTLCKVQFHGVSASVSVNFRTRSWRGSRNSRRVIAVHPDSLIGRINAAAGERWVEIDPDTERLFGLCQELFFFTRGSFDPTALPLIRLWNWKAQPPVIPTDDAICATRELVGWNKVQRRSGAVFLPRTE